MAFWKCNFKTLDQPYKSGRFRLYKRSVNSSTFLPLTNPGPEEMLTVVLVVGHSLHPSAPADPVHTVASIGSLFLFSINVRGT